VLYLPPEIHNSEAALLSLDNAIHIPKKKKKWSSAMFNNMDRPIIMALEIYYHKPVRASELRWATNKFIEANLVGAPKSIANLPTNIQHHLSSFNELYRNIKVGDRYTLEYHPEVGIRLYLNHEILGTVGNNQYTDNHHHHLREEERVELARIVFSVWFGDKAPFSAVMKRELLTPMVPPVVADNLPPSSTHRQQHHSIALTSSWMELARKHTGVLETLSVLIYVIIVVLFLWIQSKRRKTLSTPSTTTTIDMKNNNGTHHPVSSYSNVQQPLFAGIHSRAMITLTEEEMKMLDAHGVYHLLAMYYYSLRDVIVSAA
jgi:hypothetical protein